MFQRSMMGVFALVLLCAESAGAREPVYAFGRKPTRSGVLEGRIHGAHFLPDVEDYTEYWSHAFLFKSGHALYARFLVTNLGPGDNKGAVLAHLVTPDGQVHEFLDGRRDRSWSYATGRLDFRLAGHSLSGDGKSFHLRLQNEAGAVVDLAITNVIDSYRPGRVLYGSAKQEYLDFTVTSPRATAKGTFSAGGQTVELDGTGYADHFYTNFAQHKQVLTWFTFAGFTDDLSVNLTNVITTAGFGKRRIPFVAVGRGDRIVATSNSISFSQARFWRDRKASGRYRIPRLLKFSFKDKKSGDRVRVRVVAKKRLHRYDVLKGLQPFERFVVERIAKPMQYRFLAEFTITGKAGGQKVRGKGLGLLEVNAINPK